MANSADTANTPPSPSVFVNKEPLREEHIQNAVNFLSHEKVRGSPVIHRRSFLERKGLTKEEIDEAFHRVPDLLPPVSNVQAGEGKSKLVLARPQPVEINQQDAVVWPVQRAGIFNKYRFHWYQAILTAGLVAASGIGAVIIIKNVFIPRFKSWIRKIVLEHEDESINNIILKPNWAEDAASAAKAAAGAAEDVAKTCQEMLISKTQEKRCFEELLNLLDMQVQEMKSMSHQIKKLEGRVSPHPTIVDSSTEARHPKSFMDVVAMVKKGERPSNIKEINDLPPNPNHPFSNTQSIPKPKPWEVGRSDTRPSYAGPSHGHHYDNTVFYKSNGGGGISEPWSMQQKSISIQEIENEDEAMTQDAATVEGCSWVPPPLPAVVMPEAAAAIHHRKQQQHQQPSLKDRVAFASSDEKNEMPQRTATFTESGSAEVKRGMEEEG